MKAVVLSAGQGSRLLPLTAGMPKCLLDAAGRSVVAWQLGALAAAGVDEAIVVTGFRADLVDRELAQAAPRGMAVRTLFNPFYKVADNLASCWMARDALRGARLLLNGDTLFEPAVAERLLAAPPAAITLAIDRKRRYDDDDMKVQTDDARLLAIGKALPASTVNGESIGFLRFAADGAAAFVDEIERVMRTPDGTGLWYLSAIDRLARRDTDVRVASVEGLRWCEVDYPADLEMARTLAAGWRGEGLDAPS